MPLHRSRAENGVVTLTLDSPERHNALDAAMAGELRDAAAEVAGDAGVRCLVVTGAGSAFCSGADLGAFRESPSGPLARRERLMDYYRAFLDLRDLAVPTVAAVNGPAIGAGLNLALCCDLRVAATSARFGATFVRLGIHPGGGATYLLERLIGPARAAEMLLTGRVWDSQEAAAAGLVNRVVDDAGLGEAVAGLTASIAAGAPLVARATKRTLRLAEGTGLAAVLEIEALAQAATQETDDAGEGWAAFRERREPRFQGR